LLSGDAEVTYTAKLYNPQQAHAAITEIWPKCKAYLMAGHRLDLTIRKEKRSNPQNALMWAALTDIANQVDWHGTKLSAEDWKHLITASLKKQRVVPGIDGGLVALGCSTSKMSKEEMSEVLECALAFGASNGVTFNE
jgi:hypothetical protein